MSAHRKVHKVGGSRGVFVTGACRRIGRLGVTSLGGRLRVRSCGCGLLLVEVMLGGGRLRTKPWRGQTGREGAQPGRGRTQLAEVKRLHRLQTVQRVRGQLRC